MTTIQGVVCSGKGESGAFTQLTWLREQFKTQFGFEPYPGTLNVTVNDASALAVAQTCPSVVIEPGEPGYCTARAIRVRVNNQLSAVWIIPEVSGYPENQIELIAAVSMRDTLGLTDGSTVSILVQDGDA